MAEEKKSSVRRRTVTAEVTSCTRQDDLYYATLEPDSNLGNFDEVTWVEIRGDTWFLSGSLWLADEDNPYLLLDQPITIGEVRLAEADSIRLLEMQKQALSKLKENSEHSQKVMRIITNLDSPKFSTPEKNSPPVFFDKRLEQLEIQKSAVKKALEASNNQDFFLIHGPPGTGKTTVITEIVRQLSKENKSILISSHTNVAVDNVLENLFPHFSHEMVRLGSKVKVSKRLKDLIPKRKDEINKRIVGATLAKLSILVLNNRLSFDEPYFDTVIIDESSMASIPLTLCGILLAKSFILVGDHHQLPPISKTEMAPTCRYKRACHRKCESLFKLLIKNKPESSKMLDVQFRSHPDISAFSSQQFYHNQIKSAQNCLEKKLMLSYPTNHEIVDDKPITYVHMDYNHNFNSQPIEWFPKKDWTQRSYVQSSCFNRFEAVMALKARRELITSGVSPEKIWIITPYRLQREIIRKAIREMDGYRPRKNVDSVYDNISVSTVDSIQGKENDVVIYVLTWTPTAGRTGKPHIALCDYRRLNVAMTRPKKKLIIIGDLLKLSSQYPYGPLYRHMVDNDFMITAPKIDNSDDVLTIVQNCFKQKKKLIDKDLKDEAIKAKERLRRDLPKSGKKVTLIVSNEREFDDFRKEGFWDELSATEKQKCYQHRLAKKTFTAELSFDKSTNRNKINIKSSIKNQNFHQSFDRNKSESLPKRKRIVILSSPQDSRECGLVFKCLKNNPEVTNKQIAIQTKLSINRVEELRTYIEQNLKLPAINETETKSQNNISDTVSSKTTPDLEKIPIEDTTIPEVNREPKVSATIRCSYCKKIMTTEENDLYEGHCQTCYYRKKRFEWAKKSRKSGLSGSDRAGTW